ncbi:hypothetical protein DMH17_12690 [Raoultella planticola]|nr:hypothetical protein [Raoultella planticola]
MAEACFSLCQRIPAVAVIFVAKGIAVKDLRRFRRCPPTTSMRWQGSAAEPGWYEFREHFQPVNRIGRFFCPDRYRSPVYRAFCGSALSRGCSVLRARS